MALLGKAKAMGQTQEDSLQAKQTFRHCGTCSQTFGCLLNREFGHPHRDAERALTPLAGGMMNQGHQCGMIWGATLAAGLEAFRQYPDQRQAQTVAIQAGKAIIDSFEQHNQTVNCIELTGCDLTTFWGLAKLGVRTMARGMDNSPCFNMAASWAPAALSAAKQSLQQAPESAPVRSCAAEVAQELGASDEEQIMVAGFAGGIGLSGHACGALAAAIWMKSLTWCKEHPDQEPPFFRNAAAKQLLKQLLEVTDGEIQCQAIARQRFDSIEAHTVYLENGGCAKVIASLVQESH